MRGQPEEATAGPSASHAFSFPPIAAARVNGELWDLHRPLEADCAVEPLVWDPQQHDAVRMLWHSSAHLLGHAIESVMGEHAMLRDGPATESGFFYDFELLDQQHVDSSVVPS